MGSNPTPSAMSAHVGHQGGVIHFVYGSLLMADAERMLRSDTDAWAEFEGERDQWLNGQLT